jgi:hypothetical protein
VKMERRVAAVLLWPVLALAACGKGDPQGAPPGPAPSAQAHSEAVASEAPAATGRSVLEGRFVYAPPDEGEITVPLTLDMSLPGEVSLQTPAMVAGDAKVHVQYSRRHNQVLVVLEAHGLPFRPTFRKKVDDSQAFNPGLPAVKEARWRLWLEGSRFGRQHEDLYYRHGKPGTFLGTRYDVQPLGPRPAPLPKSFEIVQGNARQMIASPLFEGNAAGDLHFELTLPYDRMTDAWGTAGAINLIVPLDRCEPDSLSNYWTQGALPDSQVMTWDTFLASIWAGEGIGFAITAEPAERPESLAFRSSGFVGWANVYPSAVPRGFGLDYCTFGTLIPIHRETYQLPLWPRASRRNTCQGEMM